MKKIVFIGTKIPGEDAGYFLNYFISELIDRIMLLHLHQVVVVTLLLKLMEDKLTQLLAAVYPSLQDIEPQ